MARRQHCWPVVQWRKRRSHGRHDTRFPVESQQSMAAGERNAICIAFVTVQQRPVKLTNWYRNTIHLNVVKWSFYRTAMTKKTTFFWVKWDIRPKISSLPSCVYRCRVHRCRSLILRPQREKIRKTKGTWWGNCLEIDRICIFPTVIHEGCHDVPLIYPTSMMMRYDEF